MHYLWRYATKFFCFFSFHCVIEVYYFVIEIIFLFEIGDSKVCFYSLSCADCVFLLTWSKCPKHVWSGSVTLFIDSRVKPAKGYKYLALIAYLRVRKGVPHSDEWQNFDISNDINFWILATLDCIYASDEFAIAAWCLFQHLASDLQHPSHTFQ